jgi:hypothetical protein
VDDIAAAGTLANGYGAAFAGAALVAAAGALVAATSLRSRRPTTSDAAEPTPA